MKKLPLQGLQLGNVDFEWPTRKDWDVMTNRVGAKLKTVTVWYELKAITGIQVTLTKG